MQKYAFCVCYIMRFLFIYINVSDLSELKNYYLPTIANYIKIRLGLIWPIVLFCSYSERMRYSLAGSRKASQSLWSCDYIQNQIKYYRLVELWQSTCCRGRHQTRIRLTMYIIYIATRQGGGGFSVVDFSRK